MAIAERVKKAHLSLMATASSVVLLRVKLDLRGSIVEGTQWANVLRAHKVHMKQTASASLARVASLGRYGLVAVAAARAHALLAARACTSRMAYASRAKTALPEK